MTPPPAKLDPARLATLRRVFAADVRRRFALLRRSLRRLIVDDDAFGTGRFRFLDDAEKLTAFRAWLDAETARLVLSGDWWAKHLQAAWVKGADRAFDDARRPSLGTGTITGERKEYHRRLMRGARRVPSVMPVADARHSPRALWGDKAGRKVLSLAARFGSEMRGAADATAQRITRAVMDGLGRERTKKRVADALVEQAAHGERRALLIASSESQRAFVEGQIDGLEELDVGGVGLLVEWETTSGSPCRRCSQMEGQTFSLDDARGLIPFHANCRCVWQIT
jgi:hypothetical protein